MFKKTRFIPAFESPENVPTFVIEMKSCIFCSTSMVPPEKLGAHRHGRLLVLTVEQMFQLAQDYLENEYEIVGREVKCFHRGDPNGEIRIWLYPKDQLHLMESNEYLKFIK